MNCGMRPPPHLFVRHRAAGDGDVVVDGATIVIDGSGCYSGRRARQVRGDPGRCRARGERRLRQPGPHPHLSAARKVIVAAPVKSPVPNIVIG